MTLATNSYGGSSGVSDVIAIVEHDRERVHSIDGSWQQALLRSMRAGSAGVVVLVSGYVPYLPHVGTSPTVFDSRGTVSSSSAPPREVPAESMRTTTRQAVLRMSSADQANEVMAALNLSKTQLAEVLGVSRPTIYDWLDGKEPNTANAQRLIRLVQLLANAGVTAADSIRPRFVRESLNDGEPSLLELLKADTVDEVRVAKVLAEAKALQDDAEGARVAREDRLRALGFEEPTTEQRKENLAINVALHEWPKD
jgi:DNA-binding transcriptional regulator YiaG